MPRIRVQVPGGNVKSVKVSSSTSGGSDPPSSTSTAQNALTTAQQAAVITLINQQTVSLAAQVAQTASINADGGGAAALAAGSNTQVQFNNSGALGGSANFTWNGTNAALAGSTTVSLTASADIRTEGQIRATGWYNSAGGTSYTGAGTEMGFSGGNGYLIAYSRDASAYQPLIVEGTTVTVAATGGGAELIVQSSAIGAGNGIYCEGCDLTVSRSSTQGVIYFGSAGDQYIGSVEVASIAYGSLYVTGANGGYHGIAIYDGGNFTPTLMSNSGACGIYMQTPGDWLLLYETASGITTTSGINWNNVGMIRAGGSSSTSIGTSATTAATIANGPVYAGTYLCRFYTYLSASSGGTFVTNLSASAGTVTYETGGELICRNSSNTTDSYMVNGVDASETIFTSTTQTVSGWGIVVLSANCTLSLQFHVTSGSATAGYTSFEVVRIA